MEQLGDRQVGDLVVDRRAEEDDPLVEEARVDVEGALALHRLLDHHRDQQAHRFSSRTPSVRFCAFRPATRLRWCSLLHLLALERAGELDDYASERCSESNRWLLVSNDPS